MHLPNWLIALLTQGVGKGINTTITFIPVIGAMFLFLSFLEDSGYMARAAFVVDRLMRALGLPGKSFVPMIVGFGCNVPSVMGARTLDNKRDRILTVLMSPFMSCGARLAIFAVFTAAFFPKGGQNVVFVLYLTGIAIAMLTGLLLRKTVLKGDPAPLLMELPPYHIPSIKKLMLHVWQRLSGFVLRAGKLIVPICVLLGVLSGLDADGSISIGDGDTESLLAVVGRYVTPVFEPMGIVADNWPATVGLLTGILAKEVVIGTLNALYTQVGHFANLHEEGFNIWLSLQSAVSSIPANLSNLMGAFSNPVLAQAPVSSLSENVYGLMYQKFDGQISAMAYLFFVLLYVPCVSTTAAVWRELNRAWALFSVFWSTAVAYGVAVGFYQLMTIARHPVASISWLVGIVIFFMLVLTIMRLSAREKSLRGEYEPA
jgi:ferrous iron transport protein B